MNIKTYTPKILFLFCAWVKLDLSPLPPKNGLQCLGTDAVVSIGIGE